VEKKSKQAELTGMVMFVALVALGYAAYLYFTVGRENTNEGVLVILGLPSLILAGFATNVRPPPPTLKTPMLIALAITYAFGVYLFGIIGFVALGLAIAERSSWETYALALLWIVLGWGVLRALSEVRRFRTLWSKFTER
jgi:hypothetical protein